MIWLLVILGVGGYGKVFVDMVMVFGWWKIEFYDDVWLDKQVNECWWIVGCSGVLFDVLVYIDLVVVGIGCNDVCLSCLCELVLKNVSLVIIIYFQVLVSCFVEVMFGVVVLVGGVVSVDSCIGLGVIVNIGVIVDWDCVIGDGVYFCFGIYLVSNVSVGEGSFIGIGMVVCEGVIIGNNVVVGVGVVVLYDVFDGVIVKGVLVC